MGTCLQYYGAVFVMPAVILVLLAVWSAHSARQADRTILQIWCLACVIPFAGQWTAYFLPTLLPAAEGAYTVCLLAEAVCLLMAWRMMCRRLHVRIPSLYITADLAGLPVLLLCVLYLGLGKDGPPFGFLNAVLTPAPLVLCSWNLFGARNLLKSTQDAG